MTGFASDYYVARLLRERPTATRSGVPIEIIRNGLYVKTMSGRSRNGRDSHYTPTDYPHLFGWPLYSALRAKGRKKPARFIAHKGYRYLRTARVKS